MYTKLFLERFWEGEQKNELFVCMPFHNLFDVKFNKFIKGAKKAGFKEAKRVKEDWNANVITDKILDGIANSKMLLFDLSDDPKSPCDHSKQVNVNVIYELGIANTIRDPQDIILIRDDFSKSSIPFDISGMTINHHKPKLSVDWLKDRLTKALEKQKWYKSKRVEVAAKSITAEGLDLMYKQGRYPKGYNHFHLTDAPVETKISIQRLMDLGLLSFAARCDGEYREYAYHWTTFGYEVMKFLNIKQITQEEFEKRPEYPNFIKAQERHLEKKKKHYK